MKTSTYLRLVGWSVLVSAVSLILSISFNIAAYVNGSITFGTHTHSVVVETFDVLITGFLLPLPFGFYLVYRTYAPRLSFWSAVVGTVAFVTVTIEHVLFVTTVMWFSDPISLYLYAAVGIAFSAWLIMISILAHRSGRPAHGTLLNIIGATIAGFPIWAFWTAYLFIAGKMTSQPVAEKKISISSRAGSPIH